MGFLRLDYVSAYALLYTLRCPRRADEYEAVVGKAHKLQPSAFQLLVQLIEHDVAQYRTERSALGYSRRYLLKSAPDLHPCVEELVHQRYHTAVCHCLRQHLYQLVVVHGVEIARKVEVDAVSVALVGIFLYPAQRIMRTATRSEAETVVAEQWFIPSFDSLCGFILRLDCRQSRQHTAVLLR